MIEQLRSKQSGDTVAQYVSYLHVDLEDIGIGLGMIVDTGRINYGLEGPQLIAGMPDLTWGDFWFISPKTADMSMDKDWYRAP